ncbi:hypothetical protein TrST_g10048 [Triparma strigata]|uniref:Uncharacterized protein n=1 Tax=Triparma strigata TaxID=1606541 RepID=A0A9W7B9X2_9STRA|nr:hypothetical protein TrST_g10048 [Triparma strigata]
MEVDREIFKVWDKRRRWEKKEVKEEGREERGVGWIDEEMGPRRDIKYHLEGSARGRLLKNRLAVDPGFNRAEIGKVRLYFIPDGGRVWEEGKGPQEGRAAKWTKEAHGANSDSKIDIRGLKFIDVNMSTTEGKVLAYAWEMDCVEAWDASK